ncbi:beta-N-acetylhexosaminidase [Sediminihabitans luteus]|nr:beta-N-acetylhexosaminidase [Sediminihabitans luteus]
MVGVDANAPQDAAYAAVRDQHVGGIFVAGRSSAGVDAVADLVSSFTDLVDPTGPGGPLLVATDQEGGAVQVLKGPGFSTIPSAVTQSGWPVETIQARATGWGAELAAAGITLNLAPVMDVVPAGTAGSNPPVGVFGRQYGDDAHRVAINANAFSAGMEASGVDVAIKHFPGLGLVDANTDTTAHVVDDQTDASSPSVEAFRAGIDDGAAVVMMATAVYTRLDPDNPAAFSHDVVTGLLRDELGFDRVCMTDDVSAAVQVADVDPGQRAVRTIAAGCDLVLASAKPEMAATMVDAIVARAEEDPEFAAQVDASVERVLAMKQRLR